MRKITINTLLFALLCFSSIANAQTLQELINVALEKNYQIKILKNEERIASNNNTKGNAGQLPSINVGSNISTSFNNTLQKFADGSVREGKYAFNANINMGLMANWTIFNGMRVYAKKSQLGYLEELGQLNSKFYIEQTVSDIVMAYFQLVYEKQLLKNYQQSLKISEFRLNLEKKRKDIGVSVFLNYGQALVDYQTDSIRLISQHNTIQLLEIELNRILSDDLEKAITPNEDEITLLPILVKEELMKMVDGNNSNLEQQRLQELIAETQLRISKANKFPKIDLLAGYQYSKTFSEVGFFKSNQNYGPTIGLNVSFNLFNGGAVKRDIKNTEIYTDNIGITKQDITLNINADVLKLYLEYKALSKQIDLAKSNILTMEKVYETAAEQLKKGTISGYDFRLTQLTLLNSELMLMQLQLSSKAIEINLNRLSGNALTSYLD